MATKKFLFFFPKVASWLKKMHLNVANDFLKDCLHAELNK
jgi:hypothetical protein